MESVTQNLDQIQAQGIHIINTCVHTIIVVVVLVCAVLLGKCS